MSNLRQRILDEAPTCGNERSPEVRLGKAQISFDSVLTDLFALPEEKFFHQCKLDVVLVGSFGVLQLTPRYAWATSLLYCRRPNTKDYRWYEVSFMSSALSSTTYLAPLSLANGSNGFQEMDAALAPGMTLFQVAFGPRPIDDEDEEEFIERWMTVLAAGAEGRLKYPNSLPLSDDYWRNLKNYNI